MKKNLQKILLLMITINQTFQKSCGMIPLFNKQIDLLPKTFVTKKENMHILNNGSQLTLFGWFKLEDIQPKNHSLLKLRVVPNKNEMNPASTLENMFLMTYDNSDFGNSKIITLVADTEDKWKRKEQSYEIVKDSWFFFSYSFDYKKDIVQIYLYNQIDGNIFDFIQTTRVDFANFYLRQFFEIDVGCIPGIENQSSQNCMIGKVKQFNYILEYFENPRFLVFMNSESNVSLNYTFDIYSNQKNTLNSIISKDSSKRELKINGDLNFDKTKNNKNLLTVKGKTSFLIKDLKLSDENYLNNSPSFFLFFEYQEPLPFDFPLITIDAKKINSKITFNLTRDENNDNRSLVMNVEGYNINYKTSAIFSEKSKEKLRISLVQEQKTFWIMVSVNDQHFISPKYNTVLLDKKSNLELFEKKNSYEGVFKLYQFNILNSTSSIFYSLYRNRSDKICQQNCQLFGNIVNGKRNCIDCDPDTVLNVETSQCLKACPLGKKNLKGVCVKCTDKVCSELQKKFFKITKMNKNNFLVERLRDSIDSRFVAEDLFRARIIGLKISKDYLVTSTIMKEDPFHRSVKYSLLIDPKFENADLKVIFTLKSKDFFSNERNVIPIQSVVFDRLSEKRSSISEFFDYNTDRKTERDKIYTPKDFENNKTETNFINMYNHRYQRLDDPKNITNVSNSQNFFGNQEKNEEVVTKSPSKTFESLMEDKIKDQLKNKQPSETYEQQIKNELPIIKEKTFEENLRNRIQRPITEINTNLPIDRNNLLEEKLENIKIDERKNILKNLTPQNETYEKFLQELILIKTSHGANPSTIQIIHKLIPHFPSNANLMDLNINLDPLNLDGDRDAIYIENDKINNLLGYVVYIVFILGAVGGTISVFIKNSDKFGFQKFIQTVLIMQFVAFWSAYNVILPETLNSFISKIYETFMGNQQIFEEPMDNNHGQNDNFTMHFRVYDDGYHKFVEKNIFTHFLVNFGLIFVIQAIVIFLFILIKIIHSTKKKTSLTNPTKTSKLLDFLLESFNMKIFQTIFLMFILETVVFTLYNFQHSNFDHFIFKISIFLSFLYLILTLFLYLNTFCHSTKRTIDPETPLSQRTPNKYLFIYQGLTQNGTGKFFQTVQYLFYFLFALLVIKGHKHPKMQVVISFVLYLLLTLFIVLCKPANHHLWQIEQVVMHLVLGFAHLLFMLLVCDAEKMVYKESTKIILGDLITYLLAIVLLWNSCILIFKFVVDLVKLSRSNAEYVNCSRDVDFEKNDEVVSLKDEIKNGKGNSFEDSKLMDENDHKYKNLELK